MPEYKHSFCEQVNSHCQQTLYSNSVVYKTDVAEKE